MALPVLFYFVLTDTAGAGVMFEVSNRIFIAGVSLELRYTLFI